MAAGVTLSKVRVEENRLKFELPARNGTLSFDGSYDGQDLFGTVSQSWKEMTFTLHKTGKN